jgi:hypothetical protein
MGGWIFPSPQLDIGFAHFSTFQSRHSFLRRNCTVVRWLPVSSSLIAFSMMILMIRLILMLARRFPLS